MNSQKLPDDVATALLTLCEEGVVAAADALARFLEVDAAPTATPELTTVDALERRLGGEVTGIGFRLSGGFEGALVHLLSRGDADAILRRLPGAHLSGPPSEERARGALSEVGNIAASAFLNAVATRVRRSCLPSVPQFSDVGVRAALERLGVKTGSPGVPVVLARVDLRGEPGVSLSLVVVPEPISVAALEDRA